MIGSADLNFALRLINCNGEHVGVALINDRVLKGCIPHLVGLAIVSIHYVHGVIVSDKDPLLKEGGGSNEGYHRAPESDSIYSFGGAVRILNDDHLVLVKCRDGNDCRG